MKRKVLFLASIGVMGLSLASCDDILSTSTSVEEKEVYRDKDFDIPSETKDKDATVEYKTEEEVNKLIDEDFEYNENSSLYKAREAVLENYKSIMLSYIYNRKDKNEEIATKQRMIYDCETGNIYSHQYQSTTKNGKTQSYEIETFAKKYKTNDKYGYYTIAATITLDKYFMNNNYYSGVSKNCTDAMVIEDGIKVGVKNSCGKTSLGHSSNCIVFSNENKDYTYFEGSHNNDSDEENLIVINKNNLFSYGSMLMKHKAGQTSILPDYELTYLQKNEYYSDVMIKEEINKENYKSVSAKSSFDPSLSWTAETTLPLIVDFSNSYNMLSIELEEFLDDLDMDLATFFNFAFPEDANKKETL